MAIGIFEKNKLIENKFTPKTWNKDFQQMIWHNYNRAGHHKIEGKFNFPVEEKGEVQIIYNGYEKKLMIFYNKDNKCMIYLDDKIKKLDKGEWWPGVLILTDDK